MHSRSGRGGPCQKSASQSTKLWTATAASYPAVGTRGYKINEDKIIVLKRCPRRCRQTFDTCNFWVTINYKCGSAKARKWSLSWASSILTTCLPKSNLNAMLPSSGSSKQWFTQKFPHQNFVCILCLLRPSHLIRPFQPPSFHWPRNTGGTGVDNSIQWLVYGQDNRGSIPDRSGIFLLVITSRPSLGPLILLSNG
jgi:hypothetical protein